MGIFDIFKRDPAKVEARKIARHMKKNGIGQSDGLTVDANGDVVYDKNRDERSNPTIPAGTPPYNPN